MKLDHGTWVVVADGEKSLYLRNVGDRDFIHLEVVGEKKTDNPPAHELATDRPGRHNDATRPTESGVEAFAKSGMEETDWHRVAEERFAGETAEKLCELAAAGRFSRLVVVADPRTLGEMRDTYGDKLGEVLVAEIDKDLTNLPLDKIERSITAYEA